MGHPGFCGPVVVLAFGVPRAFVAGGCGGAGVWCSPLIAQRTCDEWATRAFVARWWCWLLVFPGLLWPGVVVVLGFGVPHSSHRERAMNGPPGLLWPGGGAGFWCSPGFCGRGLWWCWGLVFPTHRTENVR